jgi:modification methylase
MGSGTTAVAAKKLGRKYIGIDISPEYCSLAENRIKYGVMSTKGELPFFSQQSIT